jgi:uncharacterized protein YlbG (UPF0298 family)
LLFSCLFTENITFSDKLFTQVSCTWRPQWDFVQLFRVQYVLLIIYFNSISGRRAIKEDGIIIYQDRKVEWNSNDLDYISNQNSNDKYHKQSETATTKNTPASNTATANITSASKTATAKIT